MGKKFVEKEDLWLSKILKLHYQQQLEENSKHVRELEKIKANSLLVKCPHCELLNDFLLVQCSFCDERFVVPELKP